MLRGRASHVNSESVYDYLKAIIYLGGGSGALAARRLHKTCVSDNYCLFPTCAFKLTYCRKKHFG